jgi:hypothetical protein
LLRIDETSGTLVAPQPAGLINEAVPARDELLALVSASWEAFAAELGLAGVRLVAREPVPGVDLLGFDEQAGQVVVVVLTGETVEWQLARALGAAAEVSGWDAARLAGMHEALTAAVPGESPRLVVVAGGFDPRALTTLEWLARRHGVEASAYRVSVVRFGGERLLSVHAEATDAGAPDPAAEVRWLLTGGEPVAPASTPPPGLQRAHSA